MVFTVTDMSCPTAKCVAHSNVTFSTGAPGLGLVSGAIFRKIGLTEEITYTTSDGWISGGDSAPFLAMANLHCCSARFALANPAFSYSTLSSYGSSSSFAVKTIPSQAGIINLGNFRSPADCAVSSFQICPSTVPQSHLSISAPGHIK